MALALLVGCGKPATNAGRDDSLAALQKLRDGGVLSQEEYDAKVATLQGKNDALAALQKLRDGGVLSQEEYDAKVASLQGAASTSQGAAGLGGSLSSTAPDAAVASGIADSGLSGLAGGSELGGGAAAPVASEPRAAARATRKAPRTLPRAQQLALSDSRPNEPAATADNASPAAESAAQHPNAMRNLFNQARAKSVAMAHSVHDLGLKMIGRPAGSGGQADAKTDDSANQGPADAAAPRE